MQNAKSKTQYSKFKIKNSKFKMQDPKFKIQSAKYKIFQNILIRLKMSPPKGKICNVKHLNAPGTKHRETKKTRTKNLGNWH